MAHFNLRTLTQYLFQKKKEDVFVLQIGAMDGKTFDPIFEFVQKYRWKGLLVEPHPDHFEKLKIHYQNLPIDCEQAVITEKNGEIPLYYVPKTDIQAHRLPPWCEGASSIYQDRNALAFENIRPYVTSMNVRALTLPDLLKKYSVQHIDLLQIDTEGADYSILKQLDFNQYQPFLINLEIVNLPPQERARTKQLLDEQGYLHIKAGYDLLAVKNPFS